MSTGGTTSTQQSQNVTQLPPWINDAAQQNYGFAQQVASQPLQQYQGQMVANPGAQMQQAWNSAAQGGNAGQSQYDASQAGYLGVMGQTPQQVTPGQLSSTNLQPYMNPYTQNVINSTLPIMQQNLALSQNQNQNQANAANAFGGSRMGVQQGVTQAQGAQGMAQMAAQLNQANYGQAQTAAQSDIATNLQGQLANQSAQQNQAGLNLQASQGMGALGNAAQAGQLQNFGEQVTAGSLEQQQAQNQINAQMAKFQNAWAYPGQQLGVLQSALGMTPYGQAEQGQSTTQTQTSPDYAMSALGGLSMLGSMFGSGGMFGASGAFAGALSDRSMKTDITKIGVHPADLTGRRNTSRGIAMTHRKRRSDRAGREALRSPGRPTVARREKLRTFWASIATGHTSEAAAIDAGVSPAVGVRWFRRAGGMAPSHLSVGAKPPSDRYLSFAEREEIAILHSQRQGVRETARRLGRAASTISRELRRNAATRSGGLEYRASTAQWHADRSARRPKPSKLAKNDELRHYVQDRLSGLIASTNGMKMPGPRVIWKGRRSGPRQHRRWSTAWSPEQIAHRLPLDFPDDKEMRISHEAVYQALYVQGRGALRRELTACLRTGRALRVPRARGRGRGKSFVSPEIMISERSAEAEDRAVPGHWEGDLIVGLGSSAIGTLVERTTRFTVLLHLPRMEGHGDTARVKNGPALAGHGAEAVRDAIARTIIRLPQQLRRSLTWDQGAEMAQHASLRIDTGLSIYFCDPHSPWQRATNENTNGLLRQYFPKGTDLSAHSANELQAVATALNARPRKTLNWKTPAEALDHFLR